MWTSIVFSLFSSLFLLLYSWAIWAAINPLMWTRIVFFSLSSSLCLLLYFLFSLSLRFYIFAAINVDLYRFLPNSHKSSNVDSYRFLLSLFFPLSSFYFLLSLSLLVSPYFAAINVDLYRFLSLFFSLSSSLYLGHLGSHNSHKSSNVDSYRFLLSKIGV